MDCGVPVEAAAEAVMQSRLQFVVFAEVLPALPRERVLSRLRDVLLQLCSENGMGSESTINTAAIACALCSCRLVFGPQAAEAYGTFLSSCVTTAATKGSLTPLLQTMLQLIPSERLLHLQTHQRIMAACIGSTGKYRFITPVSTYDLLLCFHLGAGITARSFPSWHRAASLIFSSSEMLTLCSSLRTMCGRLQLLANYPLNSGETFICSDNDGGKVPLFPRC
jgi:hypothetical protein